MLNLVKSYYKVADHFIDSISEHTAPRLLLSGPGEESFRQAAIIFWRDLAGLEETNESGTGPQLVAIAAPSLLPIFFGIASDISDVEVEDPDEQPSPVLATLAIQAFFRAFPLGVFRNFIGPTFDEHINDERWPLRHAAVLLLFCLCSHAGSVHAEVLTFLVRSLPALLSCCRAREIPRLTNTSLWVVSELVRFYPAILSPCDMNGGPVGLIDEILSVVVIRDDTHPQILLGYCQILIAVCAAQQSVVAPLADFFLPFLTVLKQILSRPLDSPRALELHEVASSALDRAIHFAADPNRHTGELRGLFSRALDELEASCAGIDADHVRYVIMAHLCSNLSCLADRLKGLINIPDVQRAVGLLFRIFDQPNGLLDEEVLETLHALYIEASSAFTADDLQTLIAVLHRAFRSGSTAVINAASNLLMGLFRLAGGEFAVVFQEFFEIEEQLLRGEGHLRDVWPYAAIAIAGLFKGVAEHREVINPLKQRLFDLMCTVRKVPIDVTLDEDIEYANSLYEHLAVLYRVYAVLFYPETNSTAPDANVVAVERQILHEMISFSGALLRIGEVSDRALDQCIAMVMAYANHCTRRNNMILHRKAIHDVLRMAQQDHRPGKTREAGRKALRVIMAL
jgi:hypothetical protein